MIWNLFGPHSSVRKFWSLKNPKERVNYVLRTVEVKAKKRKRKAVTMNENPTAKFRKCKIDHPGEKGNKLVSAVENHTSKSAPEDSNKSCESNDAESSERSKIHSEWNHRDELTVELSSSIKTNDPSTSGKNDRSDESSRSVDGKASKTISASSGSQAEDAGDMQNLFTKILNRKAIADIPLKSNHQISTKELADFCPTNGLLQKSLKPVHLDCVKQRVNKIKSPSLRTKEIGEKRRFWKKIRLSSDRAVLGGRGAPAKVYECQTCGKLCRYKCRLLKHLEAHSGGTEVKLVIEKIKNPIVQARCGAKKVATASAISILRSSPYTIDSTVKSYGRPRILGHSVPPARRKINADAALSSHFVNVSAAAPPVPLPPSILHAAPVVNSVKFPVVVNHRQPISEPSLSYSPSFVPVLSAPAPLNYTTSNSGGVTAVTFAAPVLQTAVQPQYQIQTQIVSQQNFAIQVPSLPVQSVMTPLMMSTLQAPSFVTIQPPPPSPVIVQQSCHINPPNLQTYEVTFHLCYFIIKKLLHLPK